MLKLNLSIVFAALIFIVSCDDSQPTPAPANPNGGPASGIDNKGNPPPNQEPQMVVRCDFTSFQSYIVTVNVGNQSQMSGSLAISVTQQNFPLSCQNSTRFFGGWECQDTDYSGALATVYIYPAQTYDELIGSLYTENGTRYVDTTLCTIQ